MRQTPKFTLPRTVRCAMRMFLAVALLAAGLAALVLFLGWYLS